jgi:hypothetical protein
MFSIFHRLWLSSSFTSSYGEKIIGEISKRSIKEASGRLSASAWSMAEAEFRGYARARAIRTVRGQLRQIALEFGLSKIAAEQFEVPALERTVQHLLRQRKSRAPISIPIENWRLQIAG